MSFATLAGLVAGPALGAFVSKKVVKQGEDTVYRALEKTAGVNAGVALLGLLASSYVGGSGQQFAQGVMVGAGVMGGVAVGSRITTDKMLGDAKLPPAPPAAMKGLPPGAYAPVAGQPGFARAYR